VFETPMGYELTGSSIPAMRPTFFHLRLDAEIPFRPWVRLYGSVSLGTTINEQHLSEDDHFAVIRRQDAQGEWVTVDQRLQANLMRVDYSALRIPLNVGVKLIPDTGRFLPYLVASVGISWQNYTFENGEVTVLREAEIVDQGPPTQFSCPQPFELISSGEIGQCAIESLQMKPQGDVSTFGFDAVGAAGFQWLVTHHLGFVAEIRYHFTMAFKSAEELRFFYYGISEPYTPEGETELHTDRHGEVFTIQNQHHGLMFSIGMLMYW